jgi:transcriptional regulator with XRE-family HTH domain
MGESVFREYLDDEQLHLGLRRIAQVAAERGLSLRALAKAAERTPATVSVMFSQRHPRRSTLDRLARAVGIDPLRLHAELADLTESDADQVLTEVISLARVAGAFTVRGDIAADQFRRAFRSAPPEARAAAVQAFVCSRTDPTPLTADLLAGAFAEAAAARAKSADFDAFDSQPPLPREAREDESTISLRAFAENLGDHGERLITLFRQGDGWDELSSHLISTGFSLITAGCRHFGFTNDEIRAHMEPLRDAVMERTKVASGTCDERSHLK